VWYRPCGGCGGGWSGRRPSWVRAGRAAGLATATTRREVAAKELKGNLSESEAQRARLSQSVTELSTSLADARAKSDQLDLALKNANEVGTDVSFRTNEDSISTQCDVASDETRCPRRVHAGCEGACGGLRRSPWVGEGERRVVTASCRSGGGSAGAAGVAKDHMIVEGHGKTESTSMECDVDGYAFDRKVTVRLERAGSQEVARND